MAKETETETKIVFTLKETVDNKMAGNMAKTMIRSLDVDQLIGIEDIKVTTTIADITIEGGEDGEN